MRLQALARVAMVRRQMHPAVVADRRMPCSLLANRCIAALEDLLEHRHAVGDRAADHAQHLGGRGLVLERLGELGGALLDLALEAGVRLAAARALMRLNCSARPSSSSPVRTSMRRSSSPGADLRRAFLQRPQRPHQRAREEEARRHRDQEAGDEQQRGAQDRGVERRERLGDAATRRTRSSCSVRDRARAPTEPPRPFEVARRTDWRRRAGRVAARATCGSALRSVFFSTRLMSGCAISVPVASTT